MGESESSTVSRTKPFPGAVDHEGVVSFALYAPGKKSVHLIGDFNDWQMHADPMREGNDGLWSIEKELPRGSFAYQFLIDGKTIICDPYARYVDEDPGGQPAKAVVRPREDPYYWRHEDWQRPAFRDLLLYEMHIADYTPTRSFIGALKQLEHIQELSMNAIELMPVFGVREDSGWGYTPVYLFAPNKAYGTPNELRYLIDEAHGRGMAVILDMVLAHTGPEHPFNQMYPYDQSPWYGNGPRPNEFGLPQLDYSKEPTRFFVKDVIEYWLNDFHVDGFRFDYLKSMGVIDDKHGILTLNWAARQIRPDAYLIGEDLPEEPEVMLASGMEGAWHAYLSYAFKAMLCETDKNGYSWNDFDKAIRTIDPGASGYGSRPTMMVNYIESHDEERLVREVMAAGFDIETARRKSALGATILFTIAGEPMLYQGQGWGEATPKNMDHNFLHWQELGTPGGKGLQKHYAMLARLRRENSILRSDNIHLDAVYADKKAVVYHRWDGGGGEVLVVANFLRDTQKLVVPFPGKGKWREFFSGQEAHYEGKPEIQVEGYSAKIFIR